MTVETFVKVFAAQVPNSSSLIYTVPANITHIVRHIRFVNSTSSPVDLTVWVVPNAASAGNANLVLPEVEIASFAEFDGVLNLETANEVWAVCSVNNAITMTAYALKLDTTP